MTVAYFNKNYVKTEIFPRSIGRKISQVEEIRHASDYDEFYVVSKMETESSIEIAKEFLILVEEYICNK